RAYGTHTYGRRPETGRGAHPEKALEALGAVFVGAAMGNGARGLQRGRNGVGIFSARSRAVARVSMGRGRNRRDMRPAPDDLLWDSDVERARCHFERAALRSDRARRESRRGREGAIFLSGLDTDAQ